ncbi:MAG: hypothetical protein R3C05_02880 [Pirellulaceae bacterium]
MTATPIRAKPWSLIYRASDVGEANVPASVTIPGGSDRATFTITGVDDLIVDGVQSAEITVSAATFLAGSVNIDVTDDDLPALTLSIDVGSISENGGTAIGTVTRNTDTTSALSVTLVGNDPTEATIIGTATILAGQASVTVNIDAVDDSIADGTRTVTFTASAVGHADGVGSVDVTDDEIKTLTLTIDDPELQEAGGRTQATISRNSNEGELVVNLSSDDASEVSLPATVTILDGETSATLTINAIDDAVPDGLQRVNIIASASDFIGDSGVIEVNELQEVLIVASVDAEVQTNFGSVQNIHTANTTIYVADGSTMRLGIFEFDVSSVPASMQLSSANLNLDVNFAPTGSGGERPAADFYGYIGDGVTTLDDALQTSSVVAQMPSVATGLNISDSIDIQFLQPLLGTSNFAGFVMRSDRFVGLRSIESTQAHPKPTLRLTSGYRGALAVTFETSSVSETGTAVGTVTRNNDDIESALVVRLINGDPSE